MIRTTTLLDDNNIVAMAREFYPQSSYSKWADFDDETSLALISTLRKRGILLVAEVDGKLVGLLGAIGVPFIFNANVISGHEVIWWVAPEHRKTSIGADLLKRASSLCSLKGWKSFQMMRLEESDPRLDQLFIAEGFLPTEHCFTKVY